MDTKKHASGEARNHHWVPQCYLKGFAKGRSKKSKLYVVDALTRKCFVTTPRNVAAERDFNRIEADDFPPNAIENGLAAFEGQVDKALERICSQHEFSDNDDRAFVFNLMALLAVRNPRSREGSRQFQENIAKRLMDLTLATRERYESSLTSATNAGFVDPGHDVSYEQAREFLDRGEFKVEVPTTRHVVQEMRTLDTLLPLLFKRNWLLLKAPADSGGFVTTDHPVVLRWSDTRDRKAFYPPGFGLPNTEVIFPLSHDLALSGAFEGKEAVIEATMEIVAATNGIVIAHGHRQIYARDDRFRYMITHGTLRRGSDVLADLVHYRDKQQ